MVKIFFERDIQKLLLTSLFLFISCNCITGQLPQNLKLNSDWQSGDGRTYNKVVKVPSIVSDAAKVNQEELWYKKEVKLPNGKWKSAILILKGARFDPQVYINGKLVSAQPGGMTATAHHLKHPDIKPGNTITLEVALKPLNKISKNNASYIPEADHWRSNVSSCLWDDVEIHFSGEFGLNPIIPITDFVNRKLKVKYSVSKYGNSTGLPDRLTAEILNSENEVLAISEQKLDNFDGELEIFYGEKCKPWSPEEPNLYKLKVRLVSNNKTIDEQIINYAPKKFEVNNKQFELNGKPCKIRGGTVVWHRWVRNTEGQELAWDTAWFRKNVIFNLKERGANLIRFHLGLPPERILDLCDRYGLLVQYEWIFFHGMGASEESLNEQLPHWFNTAMRHPSVALYHPYNETEGSQLEIIWKSLNKIMPSYGPVVIEERDVIHIHKYWWSLFENLGLYYDSFDQFPRAIMVDEFGGNYLDGDGNMGGYLTLQETFLRFLGKGSTTEERLYHHTISNSQVAEYWRRIGAAGFAPFAILSSWEDGNHWYLGPLKEGRPKPVWDALTAAYSPQSNSIELWDRNFEPGQQTTFNLYFFNDLGNPVTLQSRLSISDSTGKVIYEKIIEQSTTAYDKKVKPVTIEMPHKEGRYRISAELLNKVENIRHPIISQWDFRIVKPKTPTNLVGKKVGVAPEETWITGFLQANGMQVVDISSSEADIVVCSRHLWDKVESGNKPVFELLERAIDNGKSVILADAGMQNLGQGYPEEKSNLGPLQGVAVINNGKTEDIPLIKGLKIQFKEVAEPESHIHINQDIQGLAFNIAKDYNWLWNGLRGGLIVPAADMTITGLSPSSFISFWKARGAQEDMIKGNSYYAYEFQGFYSYSAHANDNELKAELRKKVKFLVEDAPALANSINLNAPLNNINLVEEYQKGMRGEALNMDILASCGKSLSRTPLLSINFGEGKGKLIISQLLTKGRVARLNQSSELYPARYDPVAVQLLLNIISYSIQK